MTVRTTMSALINQIRTMIADPVGANQQFSDQQIQDRLDANRDDIRYERLQDAPSIVNAATTDDQAQFVFADFYSDFQYWEADAVLQGDLSGNFWKVLTPLASDYITGHWQFQLTPFVDGTAPGQYPPVYATGKVYDIYVTAADLLDFWSASLTCAYDFSSDGQTFNRSQMSKGKSLLAQTYRRSAKPRIAKMNRSDVTTPLFDLMR